MRPLVFPIYVFRVLFAPFITEMANNTTYKICLGDPLSSSFAEVTSAKCRNFVHLF